MSVWDSRILTADEVYERIDDLRKAHAPYMRDRIRIRQIINGGAEAIAALLGNKASTKLGQEDLPVVHLMDTGLVKLAQALGKAPDVKIDVPADYDSNSNIRKNAEKRERLVTALDYQSRLDLSLPYAGRWLPGYAFVPWLIMEGKGRDGNRYAKAEVRNSFDCFPGQWGPDSQPTEIAFVRLASRRRLVRRYPAYAQALERVRQKKASAPGPWGLGGATGGIWSPGRMSWEGPATSDAVMLGEFLDASGTYLMAMDDTRQMLDFVPNPLTEPAFELARRPSFDVLKGQYDHVIGLMAMLAKLNILGFLATQDAVFRETNIVGYMTSKEYSRGRRATNFFAPGTSISKPSSDPNFQVFGQIDRIERQLRIGAQYPVIQDAESPSSWTTGRGIDRLSDPTSHNIEEYHLQMRHALEGIDAKRLEWEEKMYGSTEKRITGVMRGAAIDETYRPSKDIAGRYMTRRRYGFMAGWDQPDVIVTGLQLLQAEAIDLEEFQKNLYGLENISEINKRNRKKKSEDRLYDVLSSRASEGDPRAEGALVAIYKEPENMEEILAEFYAVEEEPAQAAAMAALGGEAPQLGSPPDVTTALSRIMASGQADAGIQTVGRLAG